MAMLLIIVGEYSVMVELFYYLSKSSFFFFENFIFKKLYKYNKILIYEVRSITNVLYY